MLAKMENVVIFLLLVLSMPYTSEAKKLKRIEARIERIETRQDIDSMTRREYFSDLSKRLDDMENLLNGSLTGLSVSGLSSEQDEGDGNPGVMAPEEDRSLTDDIIRVKTAFSEEKARWRRHAADMEHSIQAAQNGLSSETQSLVKAVNNNLTSVVTKMIADVKDELATEMQDSVKGVKHDVENVMDTLDTLQSVIQNTSTVILDKLSKIEKMFDDHVSSVTANEQTKSAKPCEQLSPGKTIKPTYPSCLELYKSGERVSGAYDIVLAANSEPIRVYCDMETDGGGWTVFQRRQDGSEDFFRGWDDYASGFGNFDGEFWLGNDYISQMTGQCCHELRIDMEDFEGNSAYAKYGRFKVFPRGDDYKLDVGVYSGNASDSLTGRMDHSGMGFSTKDKDNDVKAGKSCAQLYKGAWWYKHCYDSNLNGLYLENIFELNRRQKGIVWYYWKGSYEPLKKTEMKIRKT